jgi:Dolichyl-phosphate-mannose-protein mannosyltransferase
MPTLPGAHPVDVAESQTNSYGWPEQCLLFALLFAGLMLLHAPLLRLPYFWDEAGYYIAVARDLYLTGSPIPHSTISNAHPPLVMAWLALAWKVFGYSTRVTRTAMLALAAFSLLGLFRLARACGNLHVAWAVTLLTAIYPVFFTQSSLAQVDLPAAGFTFWALLAYVDDQPWKTAFWFSAAALTKETAIVAPVALLAWQVALPLVRSRWIDLAPPPRRNTRAIHLFLPVLPLACWFAYHRVRTGFLLGNPEFLRYNVAATLNVLRIPIAFGLRLWQLFGYFGLYLLTLATALAMTQSAQTERGVARPRIAIWKQAALAVVIVAYLLFMSAVGGAVLARYLLPVVPLMILLCVATLWRRLRYWRLIVGAVAVAFVAGLFTNPPYGFSLEDNLAYRDSIAMHAEAASFLAMRYPHARVLTAWPASDELTRPWLGYVSRPFRVMRIEDFTASQVDVASAARNGFDVALVFSTKYQPPHAMFEDWGWWQAIKEKFFGYHHDLTPEQIAQRLGGRIAFQKTGNGLWVAVIALDEEKDAQLRPDNYSPSR